MHATPVHWMLLLTIHNYTCTIMLLAIVAFTAVEKVEVTVVIVLLTVVYIYLLVCCLGGHMHPL
jgi:hypothetical protein